MEQDPSLLEEKTVIREHTRKKKATHEDLFKGLKVEKVVIPLPEENQICQVCGTQMVLIGEEYVRRELEFIPATCKGIEYYSQSYGCPSYKEGLGDTEKPVIIKSQVSAAQVGKGPALGEGLETVWTKISRTTLANWIIYCSQNYFQPMYDYFHRELLKRSFAMADETQIQVLNEEGRRAQTQSFMWLFRSGEDGLPEISCMAIPRPEAAAMQGSFWKAIMDTWKRMAIRVITICRGSGSVPAGHISADTLSMPFPKENSMTTVSRQCRESSTATGYSPLRTPLKSIPVIMKSESSCVSRRKNLFWRLSGLGLTSRSLYGTPGWIKQ